ncbi:MAG: hypothetical protein AAGM22_30760, partial [Acidobacteriota bacterium]
MNLDRLAVRLRPRTDWEAVDLGFAMVRAWAPSVYGAWLTFTLPAAAVLILAFGGWGLVIFWWLLPLFEATTLRVLSRTVFGDAPPRSQVIQEAPREWPRFFADITWRRFDPNRSFHMPVTSLERSTGAERRKRLQVLASRSSDASSWIGLVFWCFGLGLAAAALAAIIVLTPPWFGIDWNLLSEKLQSGQAPWAAKGLYGLWALAIIAVDPIYTACGFCLYLSRRTDLEGWDLEIAFRSMARRVRGIQRKARRADPSTPAAVILAIALSLIGSFFSPAVDAQIDEDTEAKTPSEVVSEVMARDELRTEVEIERWQLRSDLDWFQDREPSSPRSAGILAGLLGGAAFFIEALLWLALGLAVLLILRELLRGTPTLKAPAVRVEVRSPERIAGLDVRRESLPRDVAAAALALWWEGQRLDA